jgi:hypothetical protein
MERMISAGKAPDHTDFAADLGVLPAGGENAAPDYWHVDIPQLFNSGTVGAGTDVSKDVPGAPPGSVCAYLPREGGNSDGY